MSLCEGLQLTHPSAVTTVVKGFTETGEKTRIKPETRCVSLQVRAVRGCRLLTQRACLLACLLVCVSGMTFAS